MNFLAHLYLSGDHAKIKVGNFIGDFVKGSDLSAFEPDIAKGIKLHRAIDEFTDHHDTVTKSKVRLRPKYRHYSPVIIDMFYDHFLAKNWSDYHSSSLVDYTNEAYVLLQLHVEILPQEAQFILPYMIKNNWLLNYGKLEGIHRALSGMAQRTKFNSKMDEATHELEKNYYDFEKEFSAFFPELIDFSKEFILAH